MKYRPKHIVEYMMLRWIAGMFRVLPYKYAALLGCKIADTLYVVMPGRVNEAKRRIRSVLGETLSENEINHIAKQSLRNFVLCYLDLFVSNKMTVTDAEQLCNMDESGFQEILKRAQTGEGGIVAAPHMGSWEMAITVSRLRGLPIFSVVAGQHNPLVTVYINKLRSAPELATVMRGSDTGIQQIIQLLKQGKVLAIMPDVRVKTHSIPVSFLGGEAHIGYGMAVLARRAQVPVFLCIPIRTGLTTHHIDIMPPVVPDNSLDFATDTNRITTAVMQQIEIAIRNHPDQWFWYNRRWILDPV